MEPRGPPAADVRSELARVLASREFASAPRLCDFLRFVTEEALAGRGDQIKEFLVGTVVYRKAGSYDPRLDSTVRVEAIKLRSRLERYYSTTGKTDPIRISVPKGGYLPRFRTDSASAAPDPPEHLPAIAVLPFLNLSGDTGSDYFSDGVAEEITGALARSGAMRVVSRTSAFAFRGASSQVREIGAALKVDRILEGSVRKSGDRLRIAVQLVRVPDGFQLWSETYDRRLADVLVIQEEIARTVVSKVCGHGSAHEGEHMFRPYCASPEALDFYLRGRHLVDRWNTKSEQEAIHYFEQALTADPGYALPHVGVAKALVCLATMGFAPPVDILPKAKSALGKALEFDPWLAEAHMVRGVLISRHDWDWISAEEEFWCALDLATRLAEAHNAYSIELLAPSGRFEEAAAEARRARELDPFSPAVAGGYGWILLSQRRFEECEQEFRELLASGAVYEGDRAGLAFALMGQCRYRECLDEYEKIAAIDPTPTNECVLAWIFALKGDAAEARRRLGELEKTSQSRYVLASGLAAIHFALGDKDRGFELLARAVELREASLRSLKVSFDWDPIRSDPRFGELLRKVWPAEV